MKKTAFNRYLPSYEYIPDGEPRVFGGRLYIFGSHDRFGGKDYCLNDYVCWSAPVEDLSDWHYEGVIFRREDHPDSKGTQPLYAPDVVQGPDGRYYLYYSAKDSYRISVAVCDRPAGHYRYLGDVHMPDGHICGASPGEWMEFDPAVLVDEDGRIWLYSGSGGTPGGPEGKQHPAVGAFVRELEPDMVTARGAPVLILPRQKLSFLKPGFFEASSIRRIGNRYYFLYAATDLSGLHYCTSDRPDGDFHYRGQIHSTSDMGLQGHSLWNPVYPVGNSHGGLACIQGQWYIFDHRMTNRNLFSRQGVAEPVTIGEDGFIPQAESTCCGLSGGVMDADGEFPGYIACNLMCRRILGLQNPLSWPYLTQDGEDRECGPDQYIRNFRNNSIIGFKYFSKTASENTIRVGARGRASGTLTIRADLRGEPLCSIPINMDSADWTELPGSIRLPEGKFPLYFLFWGKGVLDFLGFQLQ